MLDKLITQTRHLVVLFCKYIGYVLIAIMHTCYLLRHYGSGPKTPVSSLGDEERIIPDQSVNPLITDGYIPVEKVRGYAMEN